MDIASLTSPQQLIFINCQDFLLLNAHLLFILKYQIRRMVLNDVLNLTTYLIRANLLLCKNDEHYGVSSSTKTSLIHFNHDYVHLFFKTLGMKHTLKFRNKLTQLLASPSSSTLLPLTQDDIQPYISRINELIKQIPDLKHLCRALIRQNLKDVKSSTLQSIVSTAKLQDYLINFMTRLAIFNSNSVKLQATMLARWTQTTNQLTRAATVKLEMNLQFCFL